MDFDFYNKRYLVLIAVDEYEHYPPEMQLRGAVNGARKLSSLLTRIAYRFEKPIMLFNRDATVVSIRTALIGNGLRGLQENDLLVIYFAGHSEKLGSKLYLTVHDSKPGSPALMVGFEELIAWCKDHISAKHILFLLDSCYSGLSLRKRSSTTPIDVPTAHQPSERLYWVMAAGQEGQKVFDLGPRAVSPFTDALLEGLNGNATIRDSGIITASSLATWLLDRVPETTSAAQMPEIGPLIAPKDDKAEEIILRIPEPPQLDFEPKWLTVEDSPEFIRGMKEGVKIPVLSDHYDEEEYQYPDAFECPEYKITLDYSYDVSETPITHSQFQRFVELGYQTDSFWPPEALPYRPPRPFDIAVDTHPNQPRININFYEAIAYTRWLTETLHDKNRLPRTMEIRLLTEDEWEKAARGPAGNIFSWGNYYPESGSRLLACARQTPELPKVGQFPKGKSPYDLLDMCGLVWEWTLTKGYWYGEDNADNSLNDLLEAWRIIRGGDWLADPYFCRVTFREQIHPDTRNDRLGFRVVRVKKGVI